MTSSSARQSLRAFSSWTLLSRAPLSRALLSRALPLLSLLACGSRHPEAPLAAHPPNDAVVVPYPPPPAKVEEVPAQPGPSCVWTDGYWEFTDRWEWQDGAWVVAPPHCRLAPVELRRQQGQLWHARPRWYPDNVTLLGPDSACPSPPACSKARP